MKEKHEAEEALKRLEQEIVMLERAQTELLRRKWMLEDKVRKQEDIINLLSLHSESTEKKRSAWRNVALLLVATWGIVLSFFGIERK